MDIEIQKQFFWSDSTKVLYWLRTPEIRHRIVSANRLAKNLDVSSAQDWFYISSARNPAEDGTQGYNVCQIIISSRWLLGPSFCLKIKTRGRNRIYFLHNFCNSYNDRMNKRTEMPNRYCVSAIGLVYLELQGFAFCLQINAEIRNPCCY